MAQVFSFEIDEKRFKILSERKKFYQTNFSNNGEILNDNFFDFKKHLQIKDEYIEAAIIDPSCSGSGMLNNIVNYSMLN